MKDSTTTKPACMRDHLLARLTELCADREKHTYPGGTAPNDQAVQDALSFVGAMPANLRAMPVISLVVDGEVNFAIQHRGLYLDLGFYGDGEGGSYYAEHRIGNRTEKYHADDFPPADPPSDLLRLIA